MRVSSFMHALGAAHGLNPKRGIVAYSVPTVTIRVLQYKRRAIEVSRRTAAHSGCYERNFEIRS
jgi:hypothetical protein